MPKLNKNTIFYNIKEAREQLEEIAKLLEENNLSEIDFQIKLEHAFHHMNFAWNVRHVSNKRHKKMSGEDFNNWSKFPEEIEIYKIEEK